jgi:hypothetical protein
MSQLLRRIRHAVAGLAAEDRPAFKRIDASPVVFDDGHWLASVPSR